MILCPKTTYGQNSDTICVTVKEFRIIMQDLNAYRLLRVLDSNNVLIIANQDSIINKQERIIKNKDVLLHLEKIKRKRQSWIVGGSLGGALLIGLLTSFLVR